MTHTKTIHIDSKRAEYIKNLLSMTGKEIYDEYGLKRDETITETAVFPGTAYEMDIKLVIPMDDNDTPWTETILFFNGCEVHCSDVEDRFFGTWSLTDNEDIFTVIIEQEETDHCK